MQKPFARGSMETGSNNLERSCCFSIQSRGHFRGKLNCYSPTLQRIFNFLQTYAHRDTKIGTANTNTEQVLTCVQVKL